MRTRRCGPRPRACSTALPDALPLRRLALGVSYRGTAYHGWQSQPDGCTVQDRLEAALAESRNLLVSVINTAPMRVFWKDRDLHYLGCNMAFAADAALFAFVLLPWLALASANPSGGL